MIKKTGVIIQARMGSTRLPGKVMKEIDSTPILLHMIKRVKRSKKIDEIVVATSTLEKDDTIKDLCEENGIECFRGSEQDVLMRYLECAESYSFDTVIRLTSDCPLIDPSLIDRCVQIFSDDDELDYLANAYPTEQSKYPDGSDIEVFSLVSLRKLEKIEKSSAGREHVTPGMCKNQEMFKTKILENKEDWSSYRYTVDNSNDFKVVSFIFEEIKKRKIEGTTREIVEILDQNPVIRAMNTKSI